MLKKWVKLLLIAYLVAFKNLMNYDFTANMEQELDEVAEGKANWKDVLKRFYKNFTKQVSQC